MTAFTNTIRNKLWPYGGAATLPLWNSVTWNSFKWGQGADVLTDTNHLISNSTIATAIVSQQDVMHYLSDSIVPSSAETFDAAKLMQNSLSPSTDASYETLMDGSGYSYVYPSDTTNAGNRAISSYSSGLLEGTTYTSLTVGTTVWS